MKQIVAALVISLIPSLVWAQEVEVNLSYQLLTGGQNEPATHRIFSEGYLYVGEKNGVWEFVYGEKEYFSAVAGIFHDFFSFGNDAVFEIGIGAGAERLPDEEGINRFHPLLAGNIFIGNQSLFSDVYYENGTTAGEGWLRVYALWQASKYVALGVIHQTGDGTGPRVVLSVPRTPMRVWIAPVFSNEKSKLLLGGELVFQKRRH